MHSHFLRIVGAARQTLQKTVTRHRNLLTLAVTAFAACILFYVYCDKRVEAERNSSILTGPKKHIQASGIDELNLPQPVSDKWIVVTSINYPTKDVKRLASLKGWNLVVVGDRKTPSDWHLESVHFLSLEVQQQLGFRISKMVPENSYTRKNIGYLYAIQRGAKWIYDTDDDNKPYGKGLEQFDFNDTTSALCFSRNVSSPSDISNNLFNPYRFFGHRVMWPRGFPLEHLRDHTNGESRLRLCHSIRTPAVQQGLVHKDPDVDAIYRLLYADKKTGLNERFNEFAPPIALSPGTYSPWNSQNTLFHRNAFFTLFLPVSVAFRVTDIWRSYFSQKLLHMIGERVAFYPVNAIQNRNAHNYLSDFEQETQTYESSGKLVEFLNSWSCSSTSITNCTIELAESFSDRFWKLQDGLLVRLWVDDLLSIGYEFPPMLKKPNDHDCDDEDVQQPAGSTVHLELQLDVPEDHKDPAIERAEQKLSYFEDLYDWCHGENKSAEYFKSVPARYLAVTHNNRLALVEALKKVLIVVVGADQKEELGVLQRIYQPYFAVTLFCGTLDFQAIGTSSTLVGVKSPFNYIRIPEQQVDDGYLMTQCLLSVSEMRLQNVKGYYVVATTSILKIWESGEGSQAYGYIENADSAADGWSDDQHGQFASKLAMHLISKDDDTVQKTWRRYEKGLETNHDYKNASVHLTSNTGYVKDKLLYIPSLYISYFTHLMKIFRESRLDEKFAIAKFLQTVPLRRSEGGPALSLLLNSTTFRNQYGIERRTFCDLVVRNIRKELLDVAVDKSQC